MHYIYSICDVGVASLDTCARQVCCTGIYTYIPVIEKTMSHEDSSDLHSVLIALHSALIAP